MAFPAVLSTAEATDHGLLLSAGNLAFPRRGVSVKHSPDSKDLVPLGAWVPQSLSVCFWFRS